MCLKARTLESLESPMTLIGAAVNWSGHVISSTFMPNHLHLDSTQVNWSRPSLNGFESAQAISKRAYDLWANRGSYEVRQCYSYPRRRVLGSSGLEGLKRRPVLKVKLNQWLAPLPQLSGTLVSWVARRTCLTAIKLKTLWYIYVSICQIDSHVTNILVFYLITSKLNFRGFDPEM